MCFTLLLQSYPRSLELFTVVLAMSYKATEPTLVIGGLDVDVDMEFVLDTEPEGLCSLAALGVDDAGVVWSCSAVETCQGRCHCQLMAYRTLEPQTPLLVQRHACCEGPSCGC